MRKVIWGFLWTAVGFVFVTYVGGLLAYWFETQGMFGWDWFPNFLIGILNDLRSLSANYWAQISATAIIAFAAGLAFDRITAQFNQKRLEHLKRLGSRALELHRHIRQAKEFGSDRDCFVQYRSEVAALFISLQKEGIVIPNHPNGTIPGIQVQRWIDYLDPVGRFLYEEHIDDAKGVAAHLIENFKAADDVLS